MQTIDAASSLVTRAAWLHYVGGLKQSEVAKRLGVPSIKAHRLISKAVKDGVVKFAIDGGIAECAILEESIVRAFGLDYCEVIPSLGEGTDLIQSLGVAGASFLKREILSGHHELIGLGHGRTLAACVGQLPAMDANGVDFVSLLGGLTRNYSANPHDVMHRLASKTGARAFVMPVPFFLNSAEDMEVMLSQKGVAEVRELAGRASLKLLGIGTTLADTQLVASGMIERQEIDEVRKLGGVGELLGHFFDESGEEVSTNLTERTVSVGMEDSADHGIVAIAGGNHKARAIGSVLRSGHLSGLITDERTADALVQTVTGRYPDVRKRKQSDRGLRKR